MAGRYQLGYDLDDLMTTSTVSGVATSYQYDADGRRVAKQSGSKSTIFVYDASGQLAAESSQNEPAAPSLVTYLSNDHLGSTRLRTSKEGTVIGRYDYLPFGDELSQMDNLRPASQGYSDGFYPNNATTVESSRLEFTGKERDAETGLDYFGARYMSSAQGRFTSPDSPFNDQHPEDPQSWNLYSYTRNNPLKFIDETGEAIKYASQKLEVYSNTMRAQSPSYSTALQGFEGAGAPDITFQIGSAGLDADGITRAIGLTTVSVALGGMSYGNSNDINAVIQIPDKIKSVTVTIDTSIAKDGKQLTNTLAHEVGHANDARTNLDQYQSDGQRTKQTQGSTPHDSRPEEKRANKFKDQVNKEKREFGKQEKQQNKQLEEAEKLRIKELEKQGIK